MTGEGQPSPTTMLLVVDSGTDVLVALISGAALIFAAVIAGLVQNARQHEKGYSAIQAVHADLSDLRQTNDETHERIFMGLGELRAKVTHERVPEADRGWREAVDVPPPNRDEEDHASED